MLTKKIIILASIVPHFIDSTPCADEQLKAIIGVYVKNLQRLGKKEYEHGETINTILGICSPAVTAHIRRYAHPGDHNPHNFFYNGRDVFRDYFAILHEHFDAWHLIVQKKDIILYEPFTVTIQYHAQPLAGNCYDGNLKITCNKEQIVAIEEVITTQAFR